MEQYSRAASLGLCMIVRNEGPLLGNCLDSVQGFIDELVVVDTGSTDNTIEIARNYGARVREFRWTEDFSAARNHALQMATAAWILVLDADETLSRQDHSKLAALVSGGDADAWSLVQRTYGNNLIHKDYTVAQDDCYHESSPYAGWTPSRLVRLFRNRPEYRYRYRIHELIEPSILDAGGHIHDTDIPIHHFGRQKGESEIRSKLELYLKLGLEQIRETPNETKPLIETALVYQELGNSSAAEHLLHKALALKENDFHVHAALGAQLLANNKPADAMPVLQEGLKLAPDDIGILNMLSSAMLALGSPQEAMRLLHKALEISPDSVLTNNNLGLLYALTNRPERAIVYYRKSLELNPNSLSALTNLGMLYISQHRFSEAHEKLETAYRLNRNDPRVLYHLALSVAQLGEPAKARDLMLRARELAPADTAIASALQSLGSTG
jgi:Flp pilus assembly protein TadD